MINRNVNRRKLNALEALTSLLNQLMTGELSEDIFFTQFLLPQHVLSNDEIHHALKSVGAYKAVFDVLIARTESARISSALKRTVHEDSLLLSLLTLAAFYGYYGEFQNQRPWNERMIHRYFQFCNEYNIRFLSYYQQEFQRNLEALLVDAIKNADFTEAGFLLTSGLQLNRVFDGEFSLFEIIVKLKVAAEDGESADIEKIRGYDNLLDQLQYQRVSIANLLRDVPLLTRSGLTDWQLADHFSRHEFSFKYVAKLFRQIQYKEIRLLKTWLKDRLANPDDPDLVNVFAIAECNAYLSKIETLCMQILKRGVKSGKERLTRSYQTYINLMRQVRFPEGVICERVLNEYTYQPSTIYHLLIADISERESSQLAVLNYLNNDAVNGSALATLYQGSHSVRKSLMMLSFMVASRDVKLLAPSCFMMHWLRESEFSQVTESLRDCMRDLSHDQRKQLIANIFDYVAFHRETLEPVILEHLKKGRVTELDNILQMGLNVDVRFETDVYRDFVRMFNPNKINSIFSLRYLSTLFRSADETPTNEGRAISVTPTRGGN